MFHITVTLSLAKSDRSRMKHLKPVGVVEGHAEDHRLDLVAFLGVGVHLDEVQRLLAIVLAYDVNFLKRN